MAPREMTRFWTAGFMLLVCGWVGVQGAEGEIKNKDGVRKRGAGDGVNRELEEGRRRLRRECASCCCRFLGWRGP